MTPAPNILGSMNQDGSRRELHPADVDGRWMRWRRAVFVVLIGFYVLAPFIPVGGHPMIHLDVQHRRFYLFGSTFNSQDFWLVLLLMLAFIFGLLFVTAWRGRVWCGWGCPQTVFLEGLYRPIERLFDGPREARIRLAAAPWTAGKFVRRLGKNTVFLVLSAAIAHTATAIFVSPRELWLMIVEGPRLHLEAFGLTLGFTAVLMFNFAWFREQFCVVLCPYGRLQSVLHDRDSVTVAYRVDRGEPRGKLQQRGVGDCIDCKRCVVVCPTGIDIRNGLQMECLACTQCIDACDEIMDKVKRPRGLITFASQTELAGQPRRTLRPRLVVYAGLMAVTASTLGVSLATRTPFEANVFRARGAMPYVIDGELVRNPFEVHVTNKNPGPARFTIEVRSPVAAQVIVGTPVVELASLTDAHVPVSVSIARSLLTAPVDVVLVVTDTTHGTVREQTVRFLGR
ncbi:MAG: cytochrome c oxidase accessory protein CcoG [Archangium sp.]|nr:cytochrome c oxidase accessory protein CcoG [Archangium sp.]MDP3152690.1 cytochrome c oxidase accessory protein CcoG [Archangium sp.]MDP3574826.1 cytochrome c oxidase accessory protein CcoG [Archangium sp.]